MRKMKKECCGNFLASEGRIFVSCGKDHSSESVGRESVGCESVCCEGVGSVVSCHAYGAGLTVECRAGKLPKVGRQRSVEIEVGMEWLINLNLFRGECARVSYASSPLLREGVELQS